MQIKTVYLPTRFFPFACLAPLLAVAQAPPCQPSPRAIFLGAKGAIPPHSACQQSPPISVAPRPVANHPARLLDAPPAKPGSDSQNPLPVSPAVEPNQNTPVPMNAMMFWIELLSRSGERRRVTTDYPFQSGDRIRLHVESSVTGRLSVAHLNKAGRSQVLFPNPQLNAGDNLVPAGQETVIPQNGHFRFDTEAGSEHLILILTPGPARRHETDLPAGAMLDDRKTGELISSIASASRGLLLETSIDADPSAKFAAARGPILIELSLNHK